MTHTTNTRTKKPEDRESPLFPIVTTFGLGHMKPFPGTWGSVPTAALAGLMILTGFGPTDSPVIYHTVLACVLVGFSWACITLGKAAEQKFGKKDPSQVVADETAGQAIPLMFLPVHLVPTMTCKLLFVLVAFVAFRIFDIIKLPPAKQSQRAGGGVGILVDDIIAGIQALVFLHLIVLVWQMQTL